MPTPIPAAARAMAVFEIFAREKRALSNSDVARALSVADSSASDLLHTLHALGYLMRTTQSRRFYPTARLLEASRRISENDPLTTTAQEAVRQLLQKTNESAFFGVLDRGSVKVLAAQGSNQPLRYVVNVGERVSLHASGLGKALLGTLSPADMRARLEEHRLRPVTSDTITRVDQLALDIEAGRRRGWHQARSEGTEGVTALAMAASLGDQAIGISIAGPTERMERHHTAYLAALREVHASLLSEK